MTRKGIVYCELWIAERHQNYEQVVKTTFKFTVEAIGIVSETKRKLRLLNVNKVKETKTKTRT